MKSVFGILFGLILVFSIFGSNSYAEVRKEPTVSIYGAIESGIPNQYLVAVEICAGSERFESPQIYLSSDLVTKIPIVVKAVIAKNSCTYRDYTIKVNEPASIEVGFSDTGEDTGKRIQELQKQIDELKKQIAGQTIKVDVTEDTKSQKQTKETQKTSKSIQKDKLEKKQSKKKPNALESLIISKNEIPDSRDWKVQTLQGRKGTQFNNIDMDSINGIKNRVEQTFTIPDMLISTKEPHTIYSYVMIFDDDSTAYMLDKEMFPCNNCVEEVKIGESDCLTFKKDYNFGSSKNMAEFVCKVKNTTIYVGGIKVNSITTNENMEKIITKLLVEKVQSAKFLNSKNVDSGTTPKTPTIKTLTIKADPTTPRIGDLMTILGDDAGKRQTVIIEILDSKNIQITKQIVRSGEFGEFMTNWFVPDEMKPGKYTIKVTVGKKTAETTFTLR